jgi:tetratricopeptide (TPR) repeat protein
MKLKMIFTFAVGLATFSASYLAFAQGNQDPDVPKAAVRFQQAVELYREGSFEGALAEFRKAYQLSPSYRVLYNIAQTQYALHDFVGAYKSLTQYTNEGRGEIAADRLVQVDEMAAKLSERIAQLHIVTNVEGADVHIDDVSVGRSPLSELVPVNVGRHKVSVHLEGTPAAVRTVMVAGKEKLKLEMLLNQPAIPAQTLKPVPVFGPESGSALDLSASAQPKADRAPGRMGLIVSVSTMAVLAIGTGVFGYLALSAQKDFNDQLKTYPNTKDNIDTARSKSKSYGLVADGFGAATLLSGGVALYFLVTGRAETSKPVALSPTLGGMVLHGRF